MTILEVKNHLRIKGIGIDPRTRSRDYSKYLMLTMPKGQSIEDYIEEKPANVNIFRNE